MKVEIVFVMAICLLGCNVANRPSARTSRITWGQVIEITTIRNAPRVNVRLFDSLGTVVTTEWPKFQVYPGDTVSIVNRNPYGSIIVGIKTYTQRVKP